MARKIIILESQQPGQGDIAFRYALWADVPTARQTRYADANATSAFLAATQAEIDAIRSGAVVEKVEDARWPTGTTIAQIQGFLVSRHNAFQTQIANANPWQRYGTSWDGSSWTPVNNI